MSSSSSSSSLDGNDNSIHHPRSGKNNNVTSMVLAMHSSSAVETLYFLPLWIPSPYIPYILSMEGSWRSSSSSSSLASNKNGNNSTTTVSSNANATLTTTSGTRPTSTSVAAAPFAVITNSSLEAAEVEILKNKVFMGSRFYVTSYEFAPGAALFRGNVRTSLGKVPTSIVPSSLGGSNSNNNRAISTWFRRFDRRKQQPQGATKTQTDNNTAMVFADIRERLEKEGLRDKIQLFVLPDPEATTNSNSRRTTTTNMGMRRPGIETEDSPMDIPKPVILALPKELTPDESKQKKGWIRKIGKTLCYPLAAVSTFLYSFFAYVSNPNFFDSLVNQRDLTVLYSCIPLALGVLTIQIIHEAAHYLVAKRKKIKIGPPVPIPSLLSNLPFFGWITPLRSFPSNRAALVDFALSGPMTALAVSLGLVFAGVVLTSRATALDIVRYPFVSVYGLKSSFLLGSILSWLLPKTMTLPLAQPIPMHPLFVAGSFGLVSSALNLLPIFRLDGGRACFAAMGQKSGGVISAGTVLFIVSNFLAGKGGGVMMSWALLVAVFQSRIETPCRDEYTEVDGKRQWLWLTSFLLSLSILMPFPKIGTGV